LGITSTGGSITVTTNSSTGIVNVEVAGGGSGVTLETNGTPNTVQTLLNLINGSNITLTADGSGGVTIAASGGGGSIPQANFNILQ
jgi:phage tail sheath gpL-like